MEIHLAAVSKSWTSDGALQTKRLRHVKDHQNIRYGVSAFLHPDGAGVGDHSR